MHINNTIKRNDQFIDVDPSCYERVEKLIHKIARQAMPRFAGLGLPYDYDDVVGELQVAWLKARQGFKPDMGFAFSTYFTKAAFTHINRIVDRECKHYIELGVISGAASDDEDDALSFIADESMTPYEALEAADTAESRIDGLSPAARAAVIWLEQPPAELEQEFSSVAAKRAIEAEARRGTYRTPARVAIILDFAAKMFGLSGAQRADLRSELNRLAAKPAFA